MVKNDRIPQWYALAVGYMKNKSLSLTTRVVIIVSVLLVVLNAFLGIILMLQSQRALMTMLNARMLDISNTAAAMINGDDFEKLDENSEGTPEYDAIFQTLKYFQDNIECDYIYGMRAVEERKFVFVVDPSPDPGAYGQEVVYTDALYNASKGTADVDNAAFEDQWGAFYSSFSPIYNGSGEVVGIVGVDFNKEWCDNQITQNTFTIILSVIGSLALGVAIVIIGMAGVRRRFKNVNEELAYLSESIEELTEKIDIDGDFDYSVEQTNGVARSDDVSADEISHVGNRLREMQTTLDKYLAYMNEKAYTDVLTGVKNSSAYYETVDKLNAKIKEGTAAFAVIVFDLNSLKKVNDAHGHAVGDAFIITAVAIMADVVGKENIYRVGGDEFIIILENADVRRVRDVFELLDVTTERYNDKPKPFKERVSFSKGAAIFNAAGDTAFKDVFLRADKAMYEDKAEFYKKNGQ